MGMILPIIVASLHKFEYFMPETGEVVVSLSRFDPISRKPESANSAYIKIDELRLADGTCILIYSI